MRPSPCFSLEGVEYTYGGGWRLVIPSLEVDRGETLAVIGPTGSGKSTLLRLLHFLERPASGGLWFEGRRVSYPYPLALRRTVGMIFQRPLMLDGSVRRNIAIGLKVRGVDDDERVKDLLRRFDLEDLADREARLLSGGEMQRVALARALAFRPRVLLLDEPAASLDPGHVRAIEGIIRAARAAEKITLVIATHNLAQARRLADRVAMLSAGSLIEVQPTADLFGRPKSSITAEYLADEILLEKPDLP